jgi:diacylglycerol kinase family enzyme
LSRIFKINLHAHFEVELIQTVEISHALALSSTIDLRTCPGCIICVGGDGIINYELLRRTNIDKAISVPIGIIPTDFGNSLV